MKRFIEETQQINVGGRESGAEDIENSGRCDVFELGGEGVSQGALPPRPDCLSDYKHGLKYQQNKTGGHGGQMSQPGNTEVGLELTWWLMDEAYKAF
jgi:hypothetical protein